MTAETIKAHRPNADDNFDEAIGLLADKINTAIKSFACVDWRLSTATHKEMRQALDDLIWDFSDEQNLDLAPKQIDILIENAMKTAMSRY